MKCQALSGAQVPNASVVRCMLMLPSTTGSATAGVSEEKNLGLKFEVLESSLNQMRVYPNKCSKKGAKGVPSMQGLSTKKPTVVLAGVCRYVSFVLVHYGSLTVTGEAY